MCWHGGTARDALLTPYLLLLRMSQLLLWCAQPCKTQPSSFRAQYKASSQPGFQRGDGRYRQAGLSPSLPPREANRAHCKGWRVCSSLGTLYPLIQAAMGRDRSLASMRGVKSLHSLQHCVKVWARGLVEVGEQDSSPKPPSACCLVPEQSILPPSPGGPQALLGPGVPGEGAVQEEGCKRDAQTEVWKKPSSCRPC